jgi:pyruvate/2-oxoglutarate dehydrogenase complex dihydrolipoamide acyltransferase (E2) component
VSSSTTDRETLIDVSMPGIGTSIVEGTLVAWNKAVGDPVALDETICEVSTDKVDTECPSPVAGTVAALLLEVGETVEVGTVIARVAVDADGPLRDAASDLGPAATAFTAASADATALRSAASGAAPAQAAPATGVGRRTSPLVARIAEQHGLDLSQVAGTGRGGRVTKRDALAAVAAGLAAAAEPTLHSESPYGPDLPAADAATSPVAAPSLPPTVAADDLGGVSSPLSRMRQVIGSAMLQAQSTAATCHTVVECDMTRVEARRRQLGLTALPLVARAVVETLNAFPDLNATLDGTTITRYERVHLGVAVSLGEDGLIVPVVKDAQNLAPEGLGAAVKDLARRARARELMPDEVRGATFTITNPGAFGAVIATPVLDVPQVGILDLEAIVRRAVVVADGDGNESIGIRPIVNLILGWDHRAIDGVYAAQFLTALRTRLEAQES